MLNAIENKLYDTFLMNEIKKMLCIGILIKLKWEWSF